jgi:hypothetical protein
MSVPPEVGPLFGVILEMVGKGSGKKLGSTLGSYILPIFVIAEKPLPPHTTIFDPLHTAVPPQKAPDVHTADQESVTGLYRAVHRINSIPDHTAGAGA